MNKTKAVEDIITYFNWRKVHDVMEFLDWKWVSSEQPEVPTIGTLILTATRLLEDAYYTAYRNQAFARVATGGFYATAYWDDESQEILNLELNFQVAHWDYEEDTESDF